MPKKIILFYITEDSGHHQASLALEEAFKEIEPEIEILSINFLTYLNPVLEKIGSKTYIEIMKFFPGLWKFFYDNSTSTDNPISFIDLFYKLNFKKLRNLLENFKPDAVICTQALPCEAVTYYKKMFGSSIYLIGVLTDFSPHLHWSNKGVDLYITPISEAKDVLISKGVPANKIKILGIPVNLKFSQYLDKEKIFKKLELKKSSPIILLMGGSKGIGFSEKMIRSLDNLELEFQLLVVAGNNKRFKNYLEKKINTFKKEIRLFGFVKNIYQLMEVADLLISKPGGLTTAEALAKNLPMIIINPLPGQEEKNTRFLVKNGVGIKASNKNLSLIMEEVLNNSEKLQQMRSAAQNYARPQAARETAKLILGTLNGGQSPLRRL